MSSWVGAGAKTAERRRWSWAMIDGGEHAEGAIIELIGSHVP